MSENNRVRIFMSAEEKANAPHNYGCAVNQWGTKSCTCWKGTL